jgi:hypothetical protein
MITFVIARRPRLACSLGQQDGVDVEQVADEGRVTEQAGVLEHGFQLLRTGRAGGHDRD